MTRCDARVKLLCLMAYFVATLHARSPVSLAACALVALALAAAVRLKPGAALAALRPLAAILAITVVMQVLYFQQGPVLLQLGDVSVTLTALAEAGYLLAGLACVVGASVAFMRCTTSDELVRAFGWLLSPLGRLGVRVDAFMLALSVAFRFAPVLVGEFGQLKRAQLSRLGGFDGTVRERLASYARLFAPLVRSSLRRADRLAEAFVGRCFGQAAVRSSLHEQRVGWRDVCLSAGACALLVWSFIW